MKPANRKIISSSLFCLADAVMAILILSAMILLAACGGGGGGGSASSLQTGTFIDSPVQGLDYVTSTQSGTTNGQGSFHYRAGEIITFSIGDVVLGSTVAKSLITPLDLVAGAQDETDPTVTNILRFLQSLDVDGDLDNTIHITPQIATEVDGRPIAFNTGIEDFNDAQIADLFDSLNEQGAFTGDFPRGLRDAEEAREHFRQVLDDVAGRTGPTAMFSYSPQPVIVQEQVTFNASGSTGAIIDFLWDFGDGESGNGGSVNHIFAEAGSYTVRLTVTDDQGARSETTKEIQVSQSANRSPEAAFTASAAGGEAPLVVKFNAAASFDPDGEIVQYQWDYGDGNSSFGVKGDNEYSSPGTYLVVLTVTDNSGAIDTQRLTITVTSLANQLPALCSLII